MARIKHTGIKFPFTKVSREKTFLDLDSKAHDGIRSALMHLIFTPKGQRIRDPEFGTRLIQFIFNPSDSQTWSDVKGEIKDAVAAYVPNASLSDIEIYETDNGLGLIADIKYTIIDESFDNTYKLVVKL